MGWREDLSVTLLRLVSLVKAGVAENATFSIATAGGGAQVVSVQLVDGEGEDLTEKTCVQAYLSDDSGGDNVSAGCDGGISSGTDGDVLSIVANKMALLQTESDGDVDVTVTESTGAQTFYLVVILPNGKRVVSGAIIPTP